MNKTEMKLVLEIGKATVVINMKYKYEELDLDGHLYTSKQIVKLVNIELIADGKSIQETTEAGIYLTDGKTRFGNMYITEATGIKIIEAIKKMHVELSQTVGVTTPEEESKNNDIKRAIAIMAAAKLRLDEILSDKEEEEWLHVYNNVNNEGEEGFVPIRVTLEDLAFAKKTIGGY